MSGASQGCRRPLVAINGLFLDHPNTGTGVYTREVLSRLLAQRASGAPRYSVIGHPEHAGDVEIGSRYVSREAPLRARSAKAEKVVWEQVTLPLTAARLRADLLYAPYFSLPLVARARTMVTVHDLIPLLLPAYTPSAGFKAYFRLVSAATRRADAIVTDSRHSAHDIARLLDVPMERIQVIYLGVGERYRHAIAPREVAALRARLGLPDRFVLYLGGVDPRKNVGVLLRAMKIARERGEPVLPLALVAPRGGRFADPRVEARRLGLSRDVLFLDWIAEAEKAALYAAARAFVYPSHYEGFGLPPLEAMAAGTPVLCSQASSLPEVVGDAGILLDPDDAEGWADALARIAGDDALHAELTARGRARAASFTWENTVAGLRSVFARVLET